MHLARGSLPAFALSLRSSPRLLCTAAKQKNNGQNLEEDAGQNEQKTDLPSTEKTLMKEKVKLEEQLKETMVRLWALVRSVVCGTPGLSPGDVKMASLTTEAEARRILSLLGSSKLLLKEG